MPIMFTEICSVSDLATPALEVIQDPKLMTFLRGYHQPSVDSEGAKNPRRRKIPEPSTKTGKLPRKWLALEPTVELEQGMAYHSSWDADLRNFQLQ